MIKIDFYVLLLYYYFFLVSPEMSFDAGVEGNCVTVIRDPRYGRGDVSDMTETRDKFTVELITNEGTITPVDDIEELTGLANFLNRQNVPEKLHNYTYVMCYGKVATIHIYNYVDPIFGNDADHQRPAWLLSQSN